MRLAAHLGGQESPAGPLSVVPETNVTAGSAGEARLRPRGRSLKLASSVKILATSPQASASGELFGADTPTLSGWT